MSEGSSSSSGQIQKPGKSRQLKVKERTRFAFDITKDVHLLRTALQCNPWQMGHGEWKTVSKILKEKFNYDVSVRAAKNRTGSLMKMYQEQEFTYKTGTEEQKTERGSLLESIQALIEEANTSINLQTTDESEIIDMQGDAFEEFEVQEAINDSQPHVETHKLTKIATDRKQRKLADEERDAALLANSPPEASAYRRKRMKLSIEDELIKNKQEHDMKLEQAKLVLETEKQKELFVLENKKIELEERREKRLAEEGKRRDDMALAQLEFQKSLMAMIQKKNES